MSVTYDKYGNELHPSYGLVSLSRYTVGGGENLFGSSIRHHAGIQLQVKQASKRRDLHREWYHGGGLLVSARLSPAQFADLITSLNVGEGVPCTLEWLRGEGELEACPEESQRQLFDQEFTADVRQAMESMDTILDTVKAIFAKPGITKGDREGVLHQLRMLQQLIESNMPFVQRSFNEAMDKTVTAAKAEVEAFVEHKVRSLGLEALAAQVPELDSGALAQLPAGEE